MHAWGSVLSVANNVHKIAGTTGAAFILLSSRACERKAVASSWRRVHMQLFSSFLLDTYDWVCYMPLVVFDGTTDDPDPDDGLELVGLASESPRRQRTCNADSVHM
jgi:hypothetical protein